MNDRHRPGPLAGLTVVEMAGIGPAPLACLMLAEMGARVVRIDRIGGAALIELAPEFDFGLHGRERLSLDLKQPAGQALALRLIGEADVLVDPFRPGAMERLGLGPDIALAANPRLVYARMTGFGQDGPMAQRAGHDLGYLALSGLLHAIGPAGGKPVPPLNLVADYGGGAMFLIAGILAALFERATSGEGQIVDAAMTDGAAMLGASTFAYRAAGIWEDSRGANLLDGGAPFYDTYETRDGLYLAVCCLEPRFFADFARLLPLEARLAAAQYDRALWPAMRAGIAARLSEKTRAQWEAVFEGTDACVAPVLSLDEAPRHPHNAARATFVKPGAMVRPAPAPRFSRTPSQAAFEPSPARPADILAGFGIDADEAAGLASAGIVGR